MNGLSRPWEYPLSAHDTAGARTRIRCECLFCAKWRKRPHAPSCGWCGGTGWVWRGEGGDGAMIGIAKPGEYPPTTPHRSELAKRGLHDGADAAPVAAAAPPDAGDAQAA